MTDSLLRDSIHNPTWHSLSTEQAEEVLRTHRMKGLKADDAKARLDEFGYNELKEAPRSTFWQRLFAQFKEFLVVLLIVASVISLVLGDYIEAIAIFAIVLLNAILGVVQESRAEKALDALKKMSAPEAQVIRDGKQVSLPTRELVPGDLVILETGNYVPADVRLIEAINLKINESSLTGESVPVQKQAETTYNPDLPLGDRKNTAYMGTVVTYGRGRGLVVSTGMKTQIGVIAQMVQSFENEPTPLQRKLDQLGRTLGIAALVICGLVFVLNVARFLINPTPGVSVYEVILDMFMFAVSLAIAAVPEGLPAVVTICLALGMQRMVKRNALLRQLSAVEALGSATVICSDKTGTLTQNAMTAVKVWTNGRLLEITGEGFSPEGSFYENDKPFYPMDCPVTKIFLTSVLLCNDAFIETSGMVTDRMTWRMIGDPTEGALVVMAAKGNLWKYDVESSLPRVAEIPFDSERKLMTTIHEITSNSNGFRKFNQPYVALMKGAPDVVLGRCTHIYSDNGIRVLTEADREKILYQNEQLASQALRVIGAAFRPMEVIHLHENLTSDLIENEMIFSGLVGMIDPPRPEVKPAIETARKAGIKTVMITGDYLNTAVAIAEQIGLHKPGSKVLTGQELDELEQNEFVNLVTNVDVYARVSPQHKVKIVDALQKNSQVVSMTGDGVNDAPALKKADIGVAMGITGTDVSKEASAMVLTDDNYASIVSAIEEGRVIYSNIRKFVFYLLSCNIGEILIILMNTILGWPLPLTAIQLLVLNLITDGAPALALGLEKGDPDIMNYPPRHPDEPVINRSMVLGIIVQAIAITIAVIGPFRIALSSDPGNLLHAQTMAFTSLSISELFRAYTSRSETYSIFKLGVFSNRYMQYAVFSSLVILLGIIYIPALDPVFETTFLTLNDWLVLIPFILLPALMAELTKAFLRMTSRKAKAG
jgi:Ca2+-transporting ATPase